MIKEREIIIKTDRDRALESLLRVNPFQHPDLKLVCIGGSTVTNSHSEKSDIDIVTVTEPDNPERVDFNAIVTLSRQIKNFAQNLVGSENQNSQHSSPVIISTIRLEEAQVAMAEINGDNIIPIHWLHYPSVEFASANEPPELFFGLLNGKSILGNNSEIISWFKSVKPERTIALKGLDWLTDSLRVLIANLNENNESRSFQPPSFLKGLALHNLEYFWKWNIIAPLFKRENREFSNWSSIVNNSVTIPENMINVVNRVRQVRHQGVNADFNEILLLHKITFETWPT